jgi:hypothetical protein
MSGACGKYERKKKNIDMGLVQKPKKKEVIWWANEWKGV